ncbi:AraC family transcriptional regulator [Aliagarivorans marinus]|uniref:AraC family transcriptional regulator n=1 Tax=Aliagarivorans marinus TaxID=561965 RepID=UPI00040AACFB|nr:GyrI-like domain-containing protein [Aliagarivorans marinus]
MVDYQQRLRPVLRYLEANFASPAKLEDIAAMAYLSPYHFHRVFKASVGEPLNSYVRRLRLEAAAHALFYNKKPVTEVALDVGFASSQAMAKALQQHFGLTASQFKNCESTEAFTALMRDSKIGHLLRKNGNVLFPPPAYTDSTNPLVKRSNTMQIEQFQAVRLAYIRVTGPYGVGYDQPSDKLYRWADSQGLAEGQCMFLYLDNPEVTPEDKCRTDICITVPADTQASGDIELQDFPGGSYAVIRGSITDKSQYQTYWDALMSQVVEQGLAVDERPCFELYHSFNPENHHADVSFCEAIK